jgi:hypothetical protein
LGVTECALIGIIFQTIKRVMASLLREISSQGYEYSKINELM